MSLDPFRQFLSEVRAGRLAKDVSVIEEEAARAALKRVTYLKLRDGDPAPAFLECLPACAICARVYRLGEFADYRDFVQCDERLHKAEASGDLLPIGEPVWYKVGSGVLGGEAFFACKQRGAVWKIALPERATRGGWHRAG